jgi:ubiquinone/menaquinone biosynthesis C-methylase UbiE
MAYSSFASVYDKLTYNVDYKVRADYIAEILGNYGIKDGLLLDLACGTGSLSLELSRKGFDVIGTDASADMLSEAQTKAFENGENILFLCQKMQETDLYGTVRAIVCSLDSINHLSDIDEVKKTFSALKNFIDDGGIMIFDVNTPYKHREILGNNTFVYDESDVYCVWQNTLDKDTARVHIELDIFVKEENDSYFRVEEEFDEVIYSREKLEAYLKKAGFEIVGIYDEFTKTHLKPDSQRAVYVCKKVKQTNGFFKGILDKIKK